jgi:hypothetical protein
VIVNFSIASAMSLAHDATARQNLPALLPPVNAYASVALSQLANVTLAVPTTVVVCPAGVAVSKMPPTVS